MNSQLSAIPCSVLLVDDEENILRAITRLIQQDDNDLEVLSANSGARGLELLAEHGDVALILSDQRMPGMSGAEFLQQARELAPDAVRMVLTGYADINATMDAINKGGAARYLLKPWDDEILLRTVLDGVSQYRMLQENRRLSALVERQNAELAEWNANLKGRVMEQTGLIRRQNEELNQRNQRISRAFNHTIAAFSRLIALHSSRLQEHTGNVTELATRVAEDLGLPADQVATVRTAALLHDIGVIGIPQEILDKPNSTLNAQERDIFLQHAVRGQAALDEVEELREVGCVIRNHHEHFDGTGQPDGLAGDEIPLAARIIAFADFLDHEMLELHGTAAVELTLERAARQLGHQLDPQLFAPMERRMRPLYGQRASGDTEAEKELRPKQLMAGMLVTRDLFTSRGKLVLAKGSVLDAPKIASVLGQYRIDPPVCGVHVSWQQAKARGTAGAGAAEVGDCGSLGAAGGKPARALYPELRPKQLVEGMVIAKNLYSGTGLLLLTAGAKLDAGTIVAVTRYYNIDPPQTGVFVTKLPDEA